MNKTRKKVGCNGLAFGDQEDMEMLHQYALEGWIFREYKGVSYILYKEDPQDLIFSYDFCKVPPQEEEEYLDVFRQAGWEPLACSSKGVHFFCAKNGTVPVHTDADIQAQQFSSTFKWALVATIVAIIVLIGSTLVSPAAQWALVVRLIVIALAAGAAGGCGMCAFGCFLRTRKARFAPRIRFGSGVLGLVIGIVLLVLAFSLRPMFPTGVMKGVRIAMSCLGGGLTAGCLVLLPYQFRLWRDKKI